MHVLVIFIFATAEYHHNIAGANGVCGFPPQVNNTMPVTMTCPVNNTIRINCTDGYVRQAGTSNLFRCIEENGKPTWAKQNLPLKCIRDPKRPITTPTRTEPNFTTTTTKKAQTSTIPITSMTATATAFETTNEVATTEIRTTTTLTTLKMTTKETQSITPTNEVPSSISSICTSRQYMTTTPLPTQTDPFTTTTGVNISSKTTISETSTNISSKEEKFSHMKKSSIGGAIGIILLCLTAAVFLLWWKSRHRVTNAINETPLYHDNTTTCTYIPIPVFDSEHCSAKPNIADAADASTTDSK